MTEQDRQKLIEERATWYLTNGSEKCWTDCIDKATADVDWFLSHLPVLTGEQKCPDCGEVMQADHNSYQCHKCGRLYPKSYFIDERLREKIERLFEELEKYKRIYSTISKKGEWDEISIPKADFESLKAQFKKEAGI
jgi:ribosomal protein S27AE